MDFVPFCPNRFNVLLVHIEDIPELPRGRVIHVDAVVQSDPAFVVASSDEDVDVGRLVLLSCVRITNLYWPSVTTVGIFDLSVLGPGSYWAEPAGYTHPTHSTHQNVSYL